jgi:CubicO group peptidase (beta-lactamase class C family)
MLKAHTTLATSSRDRRPEAIVKGYLLCQLAVVLAGSAAAQVNLQSNLTGLWGVEESLGPLARGELVIDARDAEWHASISGLHAPVERDGSNVHFTLPGNYGEFRGHITPDGGSIFGHWIQPAGAFPYASRYASPVHLAKGAQNVWRGTVTPLEERISFYVRISKSSDGQLSAFVRNPEANLFAGRVCTVVTNDNDLSFQRGGKADFGGTFDAASDSLRIPLLNSYPPLKLTRRTDSEAVGFNARVGRESHSYQYRPPISTGDGWPTGTLADAGLDPEPIAELIERILTTPPGPENPVAVHSLLIARHGKLVLEEYFYGMEPLRPHDMRSASKTFTSVLIGIARQNGLRVRAETRVFSAFQTSNPDPRKQALTLGNLMSMTSGLNCDDNRNSPGNEDVMQNQSGQPNWVQYALDLPALSTPGGEHAIYCSAGMNLAAGVLRKLTETWIPDLFYDALARPLGITEYHLNLAPNGEAYMGGGLYLRARDQLKLGQLYLNGGTWKGKRLVSREWVTDSTTVHATFTPRPPFDTEHGYGYAWHSRPLEYGGHTYRDYYAAGNGGQYVIVIPSLDLVVGITGGAYSEPRKYYDWESQIVPQFIIRAAAAQ